jgi:hypothetical protein
MRYKHTTPHRKIAVRACYGLVEVVRGVLIIGFWVFLASVGNALTDCWR